MSTDQPPPLHFDELRAKAINAAQAASGKIWTDYNLHDPGVTLLEQTTFALTEIAFQADHAPRDLLTGADGTFDTDKLALFDADQVLPGRPVTTADMASCLSELSDLERVFVFETATKGLIDLVIIPLDVVAPAKRLTRKQPSWRNEVIEAVRQRFAQNRLLCTAIRNIEIAKPIPVGLHGTIAIDQNNMPERVVAEAIHRISLALKGLPPDPSKITGTTRDDVYANPAAIWPKMPARARDGVLSDIALPALHGIAGLAQVTGFEFRDPATGKPMTKTVPARQAAYYRPELPIAGTAFSLTATQDGAAVQLNNNTIHEELGRLKAQRIAAQNKLRDAKDWDVLWAGRPRDMQRAPVDAMLPVPYQIAKDKLSTAGSLPHYRNMMDGHLDHMIAPVSKLDQTYVASHPTDRANPAAARDRLTMLNYLLALQGEELPHCDPSAIHKYRGAQARVNWQLDWRENYLTALPQYNQFAGTAHETYGFLARLAHLADLGVAGSMPSDRLTIDDTLPTIATTRGTDDIILPVRPLDIFVTYDDDVEPLSLTKLAITCPWIIDNRICSADFHRATQPDAYIVARNSKGDWDVLFQPHPGGGFHPCGTHQSRDKVNDWANRVRKTFALLNQSAEQVWLVEETSDPTKFSKVASFQAHVLITGWTARTQDPNYRRYVEDLILRLAPAHIYVRPVWLSFAHMEELELGLEGAWRLPAFRTSLQKIIAEDGAP